MRTRRIIGGALASAAVMIGAWEAGQTPVAVGTSDTAASRASATTTTPATTTPATAAPATTSPSTATDPSTASDPSTSGGSSTSSGSTSGDATSGTSGSSTGGASGNSSPAASGTYTDGTFTGSSVDTRFGTVQVSVTIASGSITAVTPLHLTDAERRSVSISAAAAPELEQEVLAAQSASVDTIGGATYTSDAYLTSLQAALDQAS